MASKPEPTSYIMKPVRGENPRHSRRCRVPGSAQGPVGRPASSSLGRTGRPGEARVPPAAENCAGRVRRGDGPDGGAMGAGPGKTREE